MSLDKTSKRQTASTTPTAYEEAVSRQSKLIYGSSNEHVNSEKVLIDALLNDGTSIRTKALRVLTVCGGADNFLSLLAHYGVKELTCVDMNPHQLALGQLKLELACSDLTPKEVIDFLGMNQSLDDNAKRLEVYETILEPRLPKEVAKLLREDLMYELETGIAQFGGEINSLRHNIRMLTELGFPPQDLWNLRIDRKLFDQTCREGIGDPSDFGKAAFMDETYPETYRRTWNDIVFPTWCKVFHRAVTDEDFKKTFNKKIMIQGKYDLETLPDWLHPPIRDQIRRKRKDVSFLNSPIEEVRADGAEDKYEFISTSNIFDWVDREVASAILSTIAEDLLAPGGCMLVRMAFSDAGDLARQVTSVRSFDKVHPYDLAEVDFSHFWFRNPAGFAILTKEAISPEKSF